MYSRYKMYDRKTIDPRGGGDWKELAKVGSDTSAVTKTSNSMMDLKKWDETRTKGDDPTRDHVSRNAPRSNKMMTTQTVASKDHRSALYDITYRGPNSMRSTLGIKPLDNKEPVTPRHTSTFVPVPASRVNIVNLPGKGKTGNMDSKRGMRTSWINLGQGNINR